jgi:hypothetical protein
VVADGAWHGAPVLWRVEGMSDGFDDPAHTEAWQDDDSTDHVSAHDDAIVAEFAAGSHVAVVDVNHDGRADLVAVDEDGDGYPDEVWLDRNHDGRLDTLIVDADHDRHPDHLLADTNFDGDPDLAAVDRDGDGRADAVVADRDYDGHADTFYHSEYRVDGDRPPVDPYASR